MAEALDAHLEVALDRVLLPALQLLERRLIKNILLEFAPREFGLETGVALLELRVRP